MDTVLPQKNVKIFPNNKPWMTKDLKELLNEKTRLFYTGTMDESEQKEVKLEVKCLSGQTRGVRVNFRFNQVSS